MSSSSYTAKQLREMATKAFGRTDSVTRIGQMIQTGVISPEQASDLLGLPPTDPTAFMPPRHGKSLTDIMGQSVNETARQINEAEMRAAKAVNERDVAYNERNRLVALLARLFPSGVLPDHTSPDWMIVYIDLPTGQASWHVANAEMDLFKGVPEYTGKWDKHTTAEKWRRIEKLADTLGKFDVTITPKADQLPEDEPKDFPAEIDATVKVKWADPPVVNGGQVLASVFVAPGQSFTFDQPIMMKALHIGIDPSPYSQPGQGGTVSIFYEDA